MRHAFAHVVGAALIGAVCFPMLRSTSTDSYPLSNYPMFSRARPRAVDIDHLVAITKGGERRVVPPGLVASDEVLQAKVVIATAVGRGRASARALCLAVAARLRAHAEWADTVRIEVRSDRYDAHRYFDGDRAPVHSRVHAHCTVGGAT